MRELSNNHFECESGEEVTYNFKFDDTKTRFLVSATITDPDGNGTDANIDPDTFSFSFKVTAGLTKVQLTYQFNGDPPANYLTTITGSEGGEFENRTRQPRGEDKNRPITGAPHTFSV